MVSSEFPGILENHLSQEDLTIFGAMTFAEFVINSLLSRGGIPMFRVLG